MNLALLTDLYQLTMAYGYWKNGVHDRETAFHLTFRKPPFEGGYAIACGIEPALDFLQNFHFEKEDLQYLATLAGNDRKPLFPQAFLDYLANLTSTLKVHAVEEGEVVFGHQPLLRVEGPVLQCQLVETALLTIVNFQTLIATKAARVVHAAKGDAVLEFGARRAQGVDGALCASRAAYIGGCDATSNVLAGKTYGIPVKGTHAHSWVMLYGDELESFKAYAKALPNNCVFLVDTYDTLEGVRNAIAIGQWLRPLGHKLAGIRLDSGDLAWLSAQARQILDDANFVDVPIVASNDLDENLIVSLKEQGAKITVWGVGTRLVTGGDQAALGGVYKLAAVHEGGVWQPRIKRSEQAAKTSIPGRQQVRRFARDGQAVADAIFDIDTPVPDEWKIVDPDDATRRKTVGALEGRDLLQPALDGVNRLRAESTVVQSRDRAKANLEEFHDSIKRFTNPHRYPAGLELSLHEHRDTMILDARV